MDIILVKRASLAGFTAAELAVVRRFLFEAFDGATPESQAGWRAWWRLLAQAEPGEVVGLHTQVPRDRRFHAFHMALERRVFESQETWTSFEQFRNWLKIGSAWCDWAPGLHSLIPVPRSTSYLDLDEVEMRVLHGTMVGFLRTPAALSCLWPHLAFPKGTTMLETLMRPPQREQAHSPADLFPALSASDPLQAPAANDEADLDGEEVEDVEFRQHERMRL